MYTVSRSASSSHNTRDAELNPYTVECECAMVTSPIVSFRCFVLNKILIPDSLCWAILGGSVLYSVSCSPWPLIYVVFG